MNTVRAKFECHSVSKSRHWDGSGRSLYTATLFPVSDGETEENKKFFAATPSGKIELGAFLSDAFEPGKAYYVDFTEVPAEAPAVPAETATAQAE